MSQAGSTWLTPSSAATLSSGIPLSGGGSSNTLYQTAEAKGKGTPMNYFYVDEGGVDALGVRLVAGRNFRADEILPEDPLQHEAVPSVIMTRALAKALFGTGNAVGRVTYDGLGRPVTVIGVIEHMQGSWVDWDKLDHVGLLPRHDAGPNAVYLVRTVPGQRDAIMKLAEEHLAASEPRRMVQYVRPLDYYRDRSYQGDRNMAIFLVTAAVLDSMPGPTVFRRRLLPGRNHRDPQQPRGLLLRHPQPRVVENQPPRIELGKLRARRGVPGDVGDGMDAQQPGARGGCLHLAEETPRTLGQCQQFVQQGLKGLACRGAVDEQGLRPKDGLQQAVLARQQLFCCFTRLRCACALQDCLDLCRKRKQVLPRRILHREIGKTMSQGMRRLRFKPHWHQDQRWRGAKVFQGVVGGAIGEPVGNQGHIEWALGQGVSRLAQRSNAVHVPGQPRVRQRSPHGICVLVTAFHQKNGNRHGWC